MRIGGDRPDAQQRKKPCEARIEAGVDSGKYAI
jgi:hypothetical protein